VSREGAAYEGVSVVTKRSSSRGLTCLGGDGMKGGVTAPARE
jgi:hypothetical protein